MSTADLRAGALNVTITRDAPRTLTFVGLAPLFDGDWTATVGDDDLAVSVVGDDVAVEFTGDETSGTLTILAEEDVVITGRLSVSGRGSVDPDGSVLVRLDEQDITVTVTGDGIPGLEAETAARIAADAVLTASVAAEATLARNADNLSSGTVADARIASTIARDSEVTAAVAAEATARAADVDAEETARIAADAAEATTRGNADSALDARLDIIEAGALYTAGRELAYDFATAAQTGITAEVDVTGVEITFTVGSRPVYVIGTVPYMVSVTTAINVYVAITDESNVAKSRGYAGPTVNASLSATATERITTPGTYTRKLRVARHVGSGTLTILEGQAYTVASLRAIEH